MDASGLRERIKATLDPDASNRQAAEAELKAVRIFIVMVNGCGVDCLIGGRERWLSRRIAEHPRNGTRQRSEAVKWVKVSKFTCDGAGLTD